MRRVARHLFTFCSAVSLLLCVATCVLWARSYRYCDDVEHCLTGLMADGRAFDHTTTILTTPGGVRAVDFRLIHPPPAYTRASAWDIGTGFPPDAGLFGAVERGHHWFGFAAAAESVVGPNYQVSTRTVLVPFWALVVVTPICPLCRGFRAIKSARRARRGHCPACGYDLRASRERCPECGASRAAYSPQHWIRN
jgi:hypothetical protein